MKLFLLTIASFFLVVGFQSCSESSANSSEKSIAVEEQMVSISTAYGDIVLKLYNETPLHRDNFIKLVQQGFYDSTLFHRVIQGFMIQGGDPDSKTAPAGAMLGNGDLGYTIPAEFRPNLFHKKGALAAARMGDDVNPNKESSACQFYIVQGQTFSDAQLDQMQARSGIISPSRRAVYKTLGGTPFLDGSYTVFGEVVSGLEIVDKIAAVAKDQMDRPIENVSMKISIYKK